MSATLTAEGWLVNEITANTGAGVEVFDTPPLVPPVDTLYLVLGAITDTTAPTVTAFTASGTTSPVTINSFTGSDNTAVTGYWIGTSATAPALNDAGWSATPQTSFTTVQTESVTLYARVRDAAGNISAAATQVVTLAASAVYYSPNWPYVSGGAAVSARAGGAQYVGSAQGFTLTAAWSIAEIDVTVKSQKDSFAGTGTLRAEVRQGTPTGTLIGTATLADFTTAGNDYATKTFVFGTPLALTNGQLYYLVLEVTSPSGDACYQFPQADANVYAGGDRWYKLDAGAWTFGSNNDIHFRLKSA